MEQVSPPDPNFKHFRPPNAYDIYFRPFCFAVAWRELARQVGTQGGKWEIYPASGSTIVRADADVWLGLAGAGMHEIIS